MNAHQDERDEQQQNGRPAYGFGLGLLTGACVGAGLALWFAPRLASELRARVTDPAKGIGQRIADRYDQVSTRLGQAADEVTRKGQDVRDDVADAVAHGAHQVERYAKAAKTR
jgi:gas vesicle protein